MANEEYIFTYRCRYCGEVFGDAITGKKMATICLVQSICDLSKDKQHPGDKSFHYTEDHMGIADLIGCKIEGENTNENDNA